MWYKVGFNIGNPSAYTWARDKLLHRYDNWHPTTTTISSATSWVQLQTAVHRHRVPHSIFFLKRLFCLKTGATEMITIPIMCAITIGIYPSPQRRGATDGQLFNVGYLSTYSRVISQNIGQFLPSQRLHRIGHKLVLVFHFPCRCEAKKKWGGINITALLYVE